MNFVDPPPPPEKKEVVKLKRSATSSDQDRAGRSRLEDEQKRTVKTAFPVYASRIALLDHHRKNGHVGQEQIDCLAGFGSDDYVLKHYSAMGIRARAATSVLNLMHMNGASWESLFAKASGLASPGYSDPFGHHLLPLWRFLLLRHESRDFVLRSVGERTPVLRTAREPATDKVDAAINFSRLVLSFSEPDARTFFEDAISLAQEIDREAINQIGVLEALTTHFANWNENAKRIAAPISLNVLTDIAVRLRNEEHFPWEECIKLLVKLHPPTALAAISRWSDQGIRGHEDNLQHYLSEMGRFDAISPILACSLLVLISNVPNDLRLSIVARLKTEDQALAQDALELLAEDILLREGPTSIGWQADRFIKAASSLGLKLEGRSYRRLVETDRYLKSIKTIEQSDKTDKERVPALQGQTFTTQAAIEAEFNRARQSKGFFSAGPFLTQMVDAVSSPGDRAPFLDALSVSNFGEYNESGRVEAILAALSKWNTPSVNHWRSHPLPRVIVQRFLGLTQLYDWRHDPLKDILAATQVANAEKLAILAEGLEGTSLSLGNRALFSVSEQMAAFLTSDDAWMIFEWYLKRIVSRVSLDESAVKAEEIPQYTEESVGRFLFALMGDIDTRERWRAAHATRRLARLGANSTLDAIFAQYDRTSDNAFRDPAAPYYWLAGRLWAVISAARIVHECPQALQSVHAKLVSIATDQTLPHMLIREYAKVALIVLHDNGAIVLDDPTRNKVRAINVSPFPIDTRDDNATPRLQWSDKKDKKFDFGMDTAEYVLSPILRMFIGLSKDELFRRVEHWLVDQWHAPEKVHYWDHEPRKIRYDERRYGLYHSDKGSMPIIERHGYYLEWHAVLCVVGELLQKYPLWGPEDRWGTFQDWFAKMHLTVPPVWLADLRDPKPLEDQLWVEGTPDEGRWVSRVARKDFLAALFAENGTNKSIVNVDGSWTSAFPTREVQATISSALVNPATANALIRSLSTRERRQWAYHLPDADSDHEHEEGFREMPYKLVGWLVNVRHDDGLDVKDTWRNGIKGPSKSFVEAALAELQLEPSSLPTKAWKMVGSNKTVAQEIVWADLPERYDNDGGSYRQRETKSEGTLLQTDADVLMTFLQKEQMSLIVSIHFERRLEKEYGGTYSDRTKKTKTFEQFFIFRTDGTIEDHQGAIGTWWRARRTVQT